MTLTDLTTGQLDLDQDDFLTDEDLAAPIGKPAPGPKRPKPRPSKRPRQPILQPASQAAINADLRRLDEQRESAIQQAQPGLGPGSESGYDTRVSQPARTDIQMEVNPSFDFTKSPFQFTSTEKPVEVEPRAIKRRIGETQEEFLQRSGQFEKAKADLESRRKESRRLGRAENLAPSSTVGRLGKAFAQGAAEPFRQAARGVYLAAGGEAPEWISNPGMPLLNQAESEQFSTKLASGAGSLVPALLYGTATGGLGTSIFFGSGGLGSTYEEARSKGFDHQNALAAGVVGAAIGSLEGMLGAGSSHQARGFWRNALEESGEEAFTQLLNNANAKIGSGYDPQRAIMEGVLESGLIGGILGGALPGGLKIADLASKVQADLGRPLSPAILDAARAFIKDEGGESSAINTAEGLNNLLTYLKESKIVTPEGDPVKVYHGTSARNIEEFKYTYSQMGIHVGTPEAAQVFADDANGNILPLYANIKNPLPVEDIFPIVTNPNSILEQLIKVNTSEGEPVFPPNELSLLSSAREYQGDPEVWLKHVRDYIESKGFDGMVYQNEMEDPGSLSYIAFDPKQLKSATGNRGTFDPTDPRISYKQSEGPIEPLSLEATFKPADDLKAGVILAPAQHAVDLGLVSGSQSIGGVSIDLSLTEKQLQGTKSYLPSDLVQAMTSAIEDAKTKGQSKVNFIFQGQGDTPERVSRNIQHETFHAGQAQGVQATTMFDPEFFTEDLYAFHSPELRYDQRITDLLSSPMGQLVVAGRLDDDLRRDSLVVELAAYVASGDGARFGMNEQAQAEFLVDYFESAISHRGVEAVEALANTAQLRPTTERIINQVKENYAKQATEAFQADRPVQGIRAALAAGSGATGRQFSINETTGPDQGTSDPGNVQTIEPEILDLGTGTLADPGSLAPPPLSLPPAPFDPGFDPIITQVLLNDPAMAELTRAFIQVVHDLGLEYDPRIPPFIQLADAIARGDVPSPLIDAVYARYGLTPEQFARGFRASSSAFGRGLQHLSQIQRRLGQVALNPSLARHLPPEQIVSALLSQLHASSLGRSLWDQGGTLLRKMALGRFSTTMVNVITTVGRLPLSVADGMSGFAWGMLHPDQFRNSPTDSLLAAGRRSALNSMRSSAEVVRAMNPRQLVQLLRRQRRSESAYYNSVTTQIEQFYPDLHRQLHGLSSQIDEAGTAPSVVEAARQAVDRITDPVVRADYDRQVSQLEQRLRFDRTVAGRLVKSVDFAYTIPTLPSQWQEFFFRRPFFVGALHSELGREGINFDQVVSEGTWADLPPESVQRAVDKALEFTFAYAPHEDSNSSVERSAHHIIKGLNALGPIGFFIEAFPKAIYNGMKFWYEYGPLGALHPANNIRRAISQGGVESVSYQDMERMSRAALGTMMYVAAAALRSAFGGEEWWQIKTGKKDKNGKPIYRDIRRFQPFSSYVYIADLHSRVKEGRLIDKQPSKDIQEIYLGTRKAGDQSSGALFDTLNATFAWWGEDYGAYDKASALSKRQVGQALALPTIPLSNLRDLVAQFNADENIKRDTRDAWMGPAIDNIPWLRRSMPASQSPTEPAPQEISTESYKRVPFTLPTGPAAGQFMGLRTVSGGNFITREIARLGLNPFQWLHRDPDPTIDRAQYAEFSRMLEARADRLAESDRYRLANNAEKAAILEEMILDNDLPQAAKEKGLQANPSEALRREKLREAGEGMHRLRKRASGIDKKYRKP